MRKMKSNAWTASKTYVKLWNLNSLKGKLLRTLASLAASGLLISASPALAQSPSPYAVETNLHGVYAYTQPPAGFDPTKASAADLKLYGYPPRPGADASPKDIAQWNMVVNPALTRIVPRLLPTNIYHRPNSGLVIQNSKKPKGATSQNWSGDALSLKKPAFTSVSGSWIVPTVQQAFGTCSGTDYSSQWVGIDGFSNDELFQAGSDAIASCSGDVTTTEYYPWIEWLPAAELEIVQSNDTPFPFAPGDYIVVTVTATDFSGGQSSSGDLLFTDVTQNWQVSASVTAASLGGTFVVGQSAEWIVERPELDGELSTLANYIADPWFDATAENNKNKISNPGSAGGATSYSITMVEGGTDVSSAELFGTNVLWFFDENSAL